MYWFVLGLLLTASLLIAAVAVHLALTWANRRGYVWYRNSDRPPPRSLGLLEEIYQPSVEHVIEQQATEDTEADLAAQGEDD